MKTTPRALLTLAASSSLFTATTAAHADDPKQVCADAYEATQSLRDRGQLLDARKQATACTAITCSVYVTTDCAQWLAEIDAILPTVVFIVQDPAGATIRSVRVIVDGQAVAEQLDGKAVPINPGEHVLRFEAAGAEPVEQKVTIRKGEKKRKLSASFEKALPAESIAPLPAVPPPALLAAPASDARQASAPTGGGIPTWAWVSGGAGVVASVAGAVLDVNAAKLHSEVVSKCGGDAARCPGTQRTRDVTVPLAEERDLVRALGIGLGVAGLVGIGIGAAGIVGARPKPSAPRTGFTLAPHVSPLGAGLALQGQF